MMKLQVVPYVLRWRPRSAVAGAHLSAQEGSGGDFQRHTTLLRHPDPRRIDLPRTFLDPMEEIHVREVSQRAAVNLLALVDLSGSMNFAGRMRTVAEFCAVMAASAHKAGDWFGVIGADAHFREDVFIAPTRRRGLAQDVHALLLGAMPGGDSSAGLIQCARRVPHRRSVVFLISDFLFHHSLVEQTLALLWRHDVVPVMLCEQDAEPQWPRRGLMQLRDLETGRRRLVMLRPAIARDWHRARREHERALQRLFDLYGRTPLRLFERLDVNRLAQYWSAR